MREHFNEGESEGIEACRNTLLSKPCHEMKEGAGEL